MIDGLSSENINSTNISGTTMQAQDAQFDQDVLLGGSQYGIQIPFSAVGGVTGGDIVLASGGEIDQAGALAGASTGIAMATTASGATCNVLVHGVYALTVVEDINAGSFAMVGSVANTIMQCDAYEKAIGKVVKGAASGGEALVLL